LSEHDDIAPGGDRRRIQRFVRGTCVIIAIGILWLARSTHAPALIPALSPFVALASWLVTRTFCALTGIGLAVGVIVLVRPRWFCRWVCPLGHCAEGLSRLGRRLRRGPVKFFPLGQWILWLTLGGALLFPWPLLLWLDPLAIFSSAFTPLAARSTPATWLALLPALAVLLLSLVWPHIWCSKICPLGAFQDVLSHLVQCVRSHVHRDKRKYPVPDNASLVTRRAVLGTVLGAECALGLCLNHTFGANPARPLRPPGAADDSEFLGLCVRCGNCIRACPTQIIRPDLGGHGLTSLMSPVLNFAKGYCQDDCAVLCTRVCPSGALHRFIWKGSKRHIRMGLAKVDMSVCLLGEERECSECRRWCPYGAIRYVFSESEYCLVPQIDSAKCNGCGACEMACPTKPKKAIVVAPLPTR
jgi:ferredoxin-type protein NapF